MFGCSLKNRMILVHYQGIQHHSNPSLCPKHCCQKCWTWPVLWRPTTPSRTNTKKRCLFHHRELEYKVTNSRGTQNNKKVWPLQFSLSVVSSSLQPQGMKHTKPPCPSPTPRVYSNSCPLSWWCHSIISSSVIPFSFHLQSFPVSGSFQMSQLFTSGSQSIGASVSASVLPMNIQDWWPLGWTGLILQSKGLSRVFSSTKFKSINSSVLSFLYSPTLTSIPDYWTNHSFD